MGLRRDVKLVGRYLCREADVAGEEEGGPGRDEEAKEEEAD